MSVAKQVQNSVKNAISSVADTIYWLLLVALTLTTVWVVFQQIAFPDKIPSVFGYKMFIVLDEYMTDDLEKGDLAISKNIPIAEYQMYDAMAFRNADNLVTIHQINDITMQNGRQVFQMNALESETMDTKYVVEDRVEGKIVKVIPYVGLILLYIQMPQVMACVIAVILMIGAVALWIARKLDERDKRKMLAIQKN